MFNYCSRMVVRPRYKMSNIPIYKTTFMYFPIINLNDTHSVFTSKCTSMRLHELITLYKIHDFYTTCSMRTV